MSFEVFTDGSSNLPKNKLQDIHLLPCNYNLNDVPTVYNGDLDTFDAGSYYAALKAGAVVKTTLVNTHAIVTAMRPVLEAGKDAIYISMSSGISGTYQAATIAAEDLMEEFPDRYVHIVDSHGCGLGIGLLAIQAVELKHQGKNAREAAKLLDEAVPHICQYFTVDDLNFLKRTGRVSGATAMIGTVLNIKPILYGTKEGKIVSSAKCRGRKKAMEALVEAYKTHVQDAGSHIVGISHADCSAEALELANMIRQTAAPKELFVVEHEPFSGAHVGPGMLAVFFYGSER